MPVKSLDSLMESTAGSTDDNQSDGSSDDGNDKFADLREACEEIGANFEAAKGYVEENGSLDELTDFAEKLADDDDLWALEERYRRWNDKHRIIQYFLRPSDHDFSRYTGEFYGDYDNPEPETYNHVQQQAQEEGNLAYYKALFPEPVERFWDDDPVLFDERPDEDSHIYVTSEYVATFSDFSMEVDGDKKPRPPTNEEIEEMTSGDGASATSSGDTDTSKAPFDPREMDLEELRYALGSSPGDDFTEEQIEAVLALEKQHYNGGRKGGKKAIRGALNQLRDSQQSLDESTGDGGGSTTDSDAAKAGRLVAKHNLDAKPDHIEGMLAEGMTEEQIVGIYD